MHRIKRLIHTLRHPPEKAAVYRSYNLVRQFYIVQASAVHFQKREDDPAPLYTKHLLDVGCGESTIGEFLALSGADITAIDPNPESLKCAEKSAESFGAPIHFMQGKLEDLINSSSTYDVIIALDVLEEVADPKKFIWMLRRLLNPGGLIVLSSINRTWKAWFMHIFLSEYVYRRTPVGNRSYSRFFTPAQLAEVAAANGLKMANVQGLHFSMSSTAWELSPTGPDTRYIVTLTAQ